MKSMTLATLVFLSSTSVALFAQDGRKQIETAIAPVLANPPATGLMVFEVGEGTQAAKAGFLPGDIVTHYDGQPVETLDALSRIARSTFQEQRKLLVLSRRGTEERQAEFDPAPLGLRLVPVKERESKLLWRPGTALSFDTQAVQQAVKSSETWEILEHGEKVIGWAHSYMTPWRDGMMFRVQNSIEIAEIKQQRDVIVTFKTEDYLPVQSVRLMTQNKLVFDFYRDKDQLVGERVGIPVAGTVPSDTVSAYLSGHVAACLPQEKGTCLQSSYLADASMNAAPFSDLYCLGDEMLTVDGKEIPVVRFEQTVFGDKVAHYLVDKDRQVLKTFHDTGLSIRRSSFVEVKKQFPSAGEGFPPIDKLPVLDSGRGQQAN